jgi:hypothetical protein
MGRGHGVVVAGEVQIERLHRDDLAIAAARGSALDPEGRTHGGLSYGDRGGLVDVFEGLPEAYGHSSLALAERRRGYGRDEHVFGLGPFGELLYGFELYLGHALTVGLEEVLSYTHIRGDLL